MDMWPTLYGWKLWTHDLPFTEIAELSKYFLFEVSLFFLLMDVSLSFETSSSKIVEMMNIIVFLRFNEES